jgi:competence protein ComEC
VPFRRLAAGQSFVWDGVGFEVLAAGGVRSAAGLDENDRSVVLRLTFGESRVLLTGDAGSKLEREILEASPHRLEADVLKVGHHGSRGSTSVPFLAAVRPRLAILSVRGGVSRPLPAPEVLERLKELEVRTLRTDEHGAITVRLDARGGMEVETFGGR